MPQFSSKRRVRHAAADMFDLVADVEKYPQFVPLCTSMKVRSRTQKGDTDVIVAAMTAAYKVISQTFTSRVTLDKANLKILVEYLDGPFSRLQNRWTFKPTGDATCEVEFFIDYEKDDHLRRAMLRQGRPWRGPLNQVCESPSGDTSAAPNVRPLDVNRNPGMSWARSSQLILA